jgi:hypothetical protein
MQKTFDSVQCWAVVKAVVGFRVPREKKMDEFLSDEQLSASREGFYTDFEGSCVWCSKECSRRLIALTYWFGRFCGELNTERYLWWGSWGTKAKLPGILLSTFWAGCFAAFVFKRSRARARCIIFLIIYGSSCGHLTSYEARPDQLIIC